jgi:hypothetical protein
VRSLTRPSERRAIVKANPPDGQAPCQNPARSIRARGALTESETEDVTPEDLVEGWNEHCAPLGLTAVRELSNSRRKKALARIHEHPLQTWWEAVLGQIKLSPFLKGQGKPAIPDERPFRASFDWLIENDTNALKVY